MICVNRLYIFLLLFDISVLDDVVDDDVGSAVVAADEDYDADIVTTYRLIETTFYL